MAKTSKLHSPGIVLKGWILILGIYTTEFLSNCVKKSSHFHLYRRNLLFFTDDSSNRIVMTSLNQSNEVVLIDSGVRSPGW